MDGEFYEAIEYKGISLNQINIIIFMNRAQFVRVDLNAFAALVLYSLFLSLIFLIFISISLLRRDDFLTNEKYDSFIALNVCFVVVVLIPLFCGSEMKMMLVLFASRPNCYY